MDTVVLNLDSVNLTDDQFYSLCQVNETWKLERNARGELLIMPPIGGKSGQREADLIADVTLWNRQSNAGKVFSSSTIFRLPNGGDRSPDVAWIRRERWEALSEEEQEKFPPLCPDFAIELRSRTDSLEALREKMREYLASGLRLGWLINLRQQQVEIYRPDRSIETLDLPATLSGEEVLPGFVLELPRFS
ncbi:Uma2 family endonuclease [Pannus brasiliensis CCIBt3594]|uniref:Uma2 family endonuclease n=1 Tax=Pannus brasiliensis CCIBt3594 TaxID=1427578 RepID=A0AAW9QLE3_9CHRO